MSWPASVITRQISFGKAVVLETGDDLRISVQTKASRSLVSLGDGFRMETLVAMFETAEPGTEVVFPLPVTNQSGWADPDSRLALEVGPDKHSHLYTTTLTVFKGSAKLKQYVIGPYPVPQGAGVIDGDTMLIQDTTSGILVTVPQAWQAIIDSANLVVVNAGEAGGVALLDGDGDVIDANGNKVGGGGGGTGEVTSVNGKKGVVTLNAADVGAATAAQGAKADTAVQPAALSSYVPATRTVAGKPLSANVALTKGDVGLSDVDNTADEDKPVSTATQVALDAKADLVGGVVPTSQMPPLAIKETFVVASQAAMLALTAQRGDMAIRTDVGTTFVLASDSPGTIGDWKQIATPNSVTSVAGRQGAVIVTKEDVGLGNVENTSDVSKPISNATQAALDGKGNVIQWVEGVSPTPSPRMAGAFYMLLLGADSPVPSWATDYDTIIRIAADEGPSAVPVSATQVAHYESVGSVSTSGAMSIGTLPVGTTVLVLAAGGSTSPGMSVTNGNGNTWTPLGSSAVASIAGQVAGFVMRTTAASADTVTVNRTSAGGLSVAVFVLEGSNGTLAGTVQVSSSETNVTSASSPAVTVAQGGLVVYAIVTALDITALTAAGSTDTVAQFSATGTGNPRTLAVGFDNAQSAGSTAPGLTWTSPRSWAGITLAFNPS